MKVFILSEGKPNTGHEWSIRGACLKLETAEQISKVFSGTAIGGLEITEIEVIE